MALGVTPNLTSYGAYKPPIWNARINWAHPLTRGLLFAALHEGSHNVDFVANVFATTPGGQRFSLGPERGAGGGYGQRGSPLFIPCQFGTGTSDTPYLGDISCFGRILYAAGDSQGVLACKNAAASVVHNVPFIFYPNATAGTNIRLQLDRASATAVDQIHSNANPVTNGSTVHSVGVVASGSNGTIPNFWVDGVKTAAAGGASWANAPYTGSNQPIRTACDPSNNFQLVGTIFCSYVWGRQLSDAEMTYLNLYPYAFFSPIVAPEAPMFLVPPTFVLMAQACL